MTRSFIKNLALIALQTQQSDENTLSKKRRAFNVLERVACLSFCHLPPPPTSAESGGPLLVPHHLNPLVLEWKIYPLDLGQLVTIGAFYQHFLKQKLSKKCIIGLPREIFSRQTPQINGTPFPKKMGDTHATAASVIRIWGGCGTSHCLSSKSPP